jgi:hypothetical protein
MGADETVNMLERIVERRGRAPALDPLRQL